MTGNPAALPNSWENEGQRLSPLLDNVCATVVAGIDSVAAAQMAIGVARAQAARRRVAIADLVGESPPLEALNHGDDPHGIADSFLYGVSLNKIARPVNEAGSVFLMPSGTEAVAHEAVYANDRWRRLAAGFQQVGALLIVVAVPGTPGFAELCGFVGSLLPVGDTRFPMPPGVPIIAPPPPPAPSPPPAPPRAKAARARQAALETSASRRRNVIAAVVALGAVAVGIGTFWPQIVTRLPAPVAAWFAMPSNDTTSMLVKPTPMDTVTIPDSAAGDLAILGEIANPADSAFASRYAIFYTSANTRREAMADERLLSQPDIPTMTESGVPMDLSLWWGVLVPAATPKPIVDRINAWFAQIVGTEETKKFLADSGADPMINTPERAQEMFLTAIKEWGEYVRLAKIPQM